MELENKNEIIYASPNKRLFAVTIDIFLISILFLPIFSFAEIAIFGKNIALVLQDAAEKFNPYTNPIEFSDALKQENFWFKYWMVQLINMLLILIPILFLWDRTLGTPGKWILGCEIVDSKTFQKPTPKQNLIRFFSYIISTIPLCLGFFHMYWDKQNRCWHDILAGTVVIDTSKNTTWPQRIKIAIARMKKNTN
jgi:uncharacterized RDD family membrane protein YckC